MTARAITERAAGRATAARLARAPLRSRRRDLADRLREHFDPATLPVQQVLALAEEAGEFTAAYRRWAGLARRSGPWHDVEAELADVVITAYVTAARARHRPGRRHPRQDRSRVHPRLARTPARRLTPPPGNHFKEGTHRHGQRADHHHHRQPDRRPRTALHPDRAAGRRVHHRQHPPLPRPGHRRVAGRRDLVRPLLGVGRHGREHRRVAVPGQRGGRYRAAALPHLGGPRTATSGPRSR